MSILLSGPAGSGKSQEARELLSAASVPTIMIEFQDLYAGLLGHSAQSRNGTVSTSSATRQPTRYRWRNMLRQACHHVARLPRSWT